MFSTSYEEKKKRVMEMSTASVECSSSQITQWMISVNAVWASLTQPRRRTLSEKEVDAGRMAAQYVCKEARAHPGLVRPESLSVCNELLTLCPAEPQHRPAA